MLNQAIVFKESKKLGFKKVKVYIEPNLLRLIESWPVKIFVHPSYDEKFRLIELLLHVRVSLKQRQNILAVLFLSPECDNWKRIELELFKVNSRSCLVRLRKFH